MELSLQQNPENVYAYLALGDAYEKVEEWSKASQVYRDLKALGVTVQGLKDRILIVENKERAAKKREEEARKEENKLKKEQALREQAEAERKLRLRKQESLK